MSLREIFESHKDSEWVFVAPGGNKGDTMIYQGAFKLADEVGLKYRQITYWKGEPVHKFNKRIIIYLQGGGGWNEWWDWTPRLLVKLRQASPKSKIIVGPTTVTENRTYLDGLGLEGNVTFFAREQVSYGVMKDYYRDVRLDHDTALALTFNDGYLNRLTGDLRYKELWRLLVLRGDMEAGDVPVNEGDYDMVVDPCVRFHDQFKWAKFHLHARSITGNRSHTAIMGSVLGKDVTLFAGSYHKNRSIWEYSLKDRGVKWIE